MKIEEGRFVSIDQVKNGEVFRCQGYHYLKVSDEERNGEYSATNLTDNEATSICSGAMVQVLPNAKLVLG